MPAGHHHEVLVVDIHHGFNNDEDVDGSPADDEGRYNHQDHPGDPSQVPVLLFGAGEKTNTLEAQDHQTVADGDDEDGDHEGNDEDADFHHCVPVPFRFGESQCAGGVSWELKQLEVYGRAMWRGQFKLITQLKCFLFNDEIAP